MNGITYKDAVYRGDLARMLFHEILEFDQVQVHTDLTKEEIINQLKALESQAFLFDT